MAQENGRGRMEVHGGCIVVMTEWQALVKPGLRCVLVDDGRIGELVVQVLVSYVKRLSKVDLFEDNKTILKRT